MRIAFLGTGNMGLPMARNLAHAGHALTVWNRTRERASSLEADGAKIAATVREAAADAEIAVTMLADDRALEEVAAQILDALPREAVHCGMSTVSPAISRRLAEAHAARWQSYVAAPVFGRPEAAAARKLWVVAAGPPGSVERCRPLFDAVGRGVTVVGAEPWAANVVKLAGNMSIAAVVETLGEAYTLMRRSGIEPAQFLEVINNALFQSPLYANYGTIIAGRRFDPPGFRLRLGLKDVKLLLEAAESREVPMPLASLIRDRMLAGIARGGGELDWSSFSTEG